MSKMGHLPVDFLGPFAWPDLPDAPSVFLAPEARLLRGIYLWTSPSEEGHIVYYVGETGRSFLTRLTEHYQEHASGFYHLYSAPEFLKGRKVQIWPGRYDPRNAKSLLECVTKYPELAQTIAELTNTYRFFLAPLDCEPRLRQRIEAAISARLMSASGVAGSFQDEGIRYRPRREGEGPVACEVTAATTVLGFPMSVSV